MESPPKCPLRPLSDRVVVRVTAGVRITPGGILIPDHPKSRQGRKVHEGVVAAVGPGRRLKDGTFAPPAVGVGDEVVFTTCGGRQEYLRDGVVWVLMNQHDLLCKVERH